MLKYIPHKSKAIEFSLLLIRIVGGGFMLTHGWGKMMNLLNANFEFLDPIGIGKEASLGLVVFSEILCSLLLLTGLLTRWASIPLIITMIVAVFVVHAQDGFAKQEMGLIYMIIYLVLLLCGPGRYSIDGMMNQKKRRYY